MRRDLLRGHGILSVAGCQPADKCVVAAIGLEASARKSRVSEVRKSKPSQGVTELVFLRR